METSMIESSLILTHSPNLSNQNLLIVLFAHQINIKAK